MPVIAKDKEKKIRFAPRMCPICGSATFMIHAMKGPDKSIAHYYHCRCGVVFQDEFPLEGRKHEDVYHKDYADGYLALGQKYVDMCEYPVRLFAPMIEEMTYGRKFLEVGYSSHFLMNAMKARGWLCWGIDVFSEQENERLIKADFEAYDFKAMNFNLIWMSHVLEHFKNPLEALKKCYDIMPEDGVLYLATPDTDFIHTRSNAGFTHWKKDEHYIMWNKESLTRELKKLGFEIVLARRNYEQRFTSWDDVQIIAQKRFF